MTNDKKDDVDIEKIYGNLCRTSTEKFISEFKIKNSGLTDAEVSDRLNRYGNNEITQSKPKRWYNYLFSS